MKKIEFARNVGRSRKADWKQPEATMKFWAWLAVMLCCVPYSSSGYVGQFTIENTGSVNLWYNVVDGGSGNPLQEGNNLNAGYTTVLYDNDYSNGGASGPPGSTVTLYWGTGGTWQFQQVLATLPWSRTEIDPDLNFGPFYISADGIPTNGPTDNNDGGPPCKDGSGADDDSGDDGGDDSSCSSCSGMPVWSVTEPYINLHLRDEPLGYQPASGPRISFGLRFKQRENTAGLNTNWFSVGKKWNFSWFSYVALDPTTGSNVVHFANGRQRIFSSTIDYLTNTRLSGHTNTGFTVSYPDGSQDVYGFLVTNSTGAFLAAFLSQQLNPQSQQTLLNYSSYVPGSAPVVRLTNVVDNDGRTNWIYYNTNNPYSTNLISQVEDAFGRSCYLSYDTNGHLTNITDVAGISSSMNYDTNDWATNLITPYGTTFFQLIDINSILLTACSRSVLVTQPDGSQHLFLYTNGAPGVVGSFSSGQVPNTSPFANNFDNTALTNWDTFHWGPMQYQNLSTTNIASFTAQDYAKARMRHWLLSSSGLIGDTVSLQQAPSVDGAGNVPGQVTWYDYYGKTSTEYEGSQYSPLFAAKVLPDGTTWFKRTDRNSIGNVVTNTSTYTSNNSVELRTNIYTYDSSGVDLLTMTNALGVQISSNFYNSYNEVLTNYDALNQTTVYTYNANQQVTSITLPTGLIVTNIYNSSNLLATNFSYSITGSSTQYFGTNMYTYANDLVVLHTDARGLTTTNTWDNLQRLVRVDYPDGFVTNAYSNLDLVLTVDRMGFTNSFSYDNMRRLTNQVNALGYPTYYVYCTCGSLEYVEDALGNFTHFYYDNQGRRTNIVYADQYSITNNYDLMRRLTNVMDSAGTSTTNWFNNQGTRFAVSNAMGRVSALTYDILDRVTNSVDANGVTIITTYDNLNRMLTRSYPDTGVEKFGYSALGLIAYTNQLTNIIYYGYDAALRKTFETNANQEVTRYTYSRANDLLTLTDGKTNTTSWNYDQYGRVTNKVDALTNIIATNAYDADNRMVTRWTAAKGTTSYYYDNVGNLTNIAYPVSPSITMEYDALNRLTNMIDAVGTNCFTYDGVGQLLSAGGLWANDTVSYTYNNRLRASLSLQQPDADPWVQSYGYDAAKRMTDTASTAGTFTYSYDATAKMLVNKLSLPNGAYITNDYDSVARLLDTWLKNSGNTNLDSYTYSYNVGNERKSQTRTAGDYVDYGYDPIGQLINATGTESNMSTARLLEQFGYGYDAAHNLNLRTNNALVDTFNVTSLNELTNITHSGTLTVAGTTGAPATNVTVNGTNNAALYADATFAAAGFVITNGSNSFTAIASDNLGRWSTNTVTVYMPATNNYTYDLNGNLLSDGARTFAYDDENQMISVIVSNGIGIPTLTTNIYDGAMRRRIRREFVWQSGQWIQTNEVRYIYDGSVSIQERDINNLPTATYTRGKDLSGSLQGAGGIGGLLARWDRTTQAITFYHADGNGNVTALINSLQFIVAKYLYDPFGNILSISGPLAGANVYRFSSKEWDQNSGLIYYLYRFYDPNLQRWMNRDPRQELGGINLYRFLRNNPIGFVDPFGLALYPPNFVGPLQQGDVRFDCDAAKAAIDHLNNIIRDAISSMGDINQMFDSAVTWARVGEVAEFLYVIPAAYGVHAEYAETAAAGTKVFVTAAGRGFVTAEASVNGPHYFFTYLLPLPYNVNYANPVESAAENYNETGAEMSENTYETIKQLQELARTLQEQYEKYCKCDHSNSGQ